MWQQFEDGRSINTRGSESGTILRDEEHPAGARITLERAGYTPFSITCGIYGWMVHTAFFMAEAEARHTFEDMKIAIENILNMIPLSDEPNAEEKSELVSDAISDFVSRY